ncbi:hypothetical protein SynBIOSU31_01855 [Synechococcus sp. BIOS-U3-1]|nr:hypothetical protein SynBIOSU31_01855 [Synechococcus sp. BIOS-U3-1]
MIAHAVDQSMSRSLMALKIQCGLHFLMVNRFRFCCLNDV